MRLSKFFFLATLAAIPIQLGKFFWVDFSYILGIPVDYRAVTLYFVDLVLLAYLATFLVENFKNLKKLFVSRKIVILILIAINLYFFASAFLTQKPLAPLYFSLKFLEFSLFGLFASVTIESKEFYKFGSRILGFTLAWQSLLIALQFIFQKSLGLWFLGERAFDASTVGIAHIEIFGKQLLRPYGTFPHPNVMGAFLIIGYLLWSTPQAIRKKQIPQKLISVVTFCAIILTFSKSALLALISYALVQITSIKYGALALIGIIGSLILYLKSVPESQIASISERLLLAQAAFDITLKNPFLGVGSGNFIGELASLNLYSISEVRLLQPVHNIFLLIMAENGLIGLFLVTLLLAVVLKNANSKIKIALFIIVLVYATTDHFFWTLNQGRLLFWLAIGYILASPKAKRG